MNMAYHFRQEPVLAHSAVMSKLGTTGEALARYYACCRIRLYASIKRM